MKVSIHINPWAVDGNGIIVELRAESVNENTLLELASRKQVSHHSLGGFASTHTPETKTLTFSLRDAGSFGGMQSQNLVPDKAIA